MADFVFSVGASEAKSHFKNCSKRYAQRAERARKVVAVVKNIEVHPTGVCAFDDKFERAFGCELDPPEREAVKSLFDDLARRGFFGDPQEGCLGDPESEEFDLRKALIEGGEELISLHEHASKEFEFFADHVPRETQSLDVKNLIQFEFIPHPEDCD